MSADKSLEGQFQLKEVADFKIKYLQFINSQSQAVQKLPYFAENKDTLIELYKWMLLTRTLDTKAVNLQRTGKLGTYPSSYGQEAVSVAVGFAMNKDDVLATYYRDQGAAIQRGIKPEDVLTYWGGDERGSAYEDCPEDTPIAVPIASQGLHATGIAYAMKYRKEKRAVVTTCGDGATSQGDFYEALNVAGAWNLPVVFVVNNNQWAISVPRSEQTNVQTIAQKAIAAGFEGVQVDGNDVIATTEAIKYALEKARRGDGPTLIEAITYRLCDHTTADDATRYHDPKVYEQALKEEPVVRLREYMHQQGFWDKDKDFALSKECSLEVERATQAYLDQPKQAKTDMFDYLYAELPEAYLDQREELNN